MEIQLTEKEHELQETKDLLKENQDMIKRTESKMEKMARHRVRTKNKGIGKTTGRKRKRTTRVQRKSQRNGITRGENERGRA